MSRTFLHDGLSLDCYEQVAEVGIKPRISMRLFKRKGVWYYEFGRKHRRSLKTKDPVEARRLYNGLKKKWDGFVKKQEDMIKASKDGYELRRRKVVQDAKKYNQTSYEYKRSLTEYKESIKNFNYLEEKLKSIKIELKEYKSSMSKIMNLYYKKLRILQNSLDSWLAED